jgi:schlafen family protein
MRVTASRAYLARQTWYLIFGPQARFAPSILVGSQPPVAVQRIVCQDNCMPTPDELRRLLNAPNETLAIEYKSWLSFADNAGKATLAKAAIALVNHGGGIIVLGMRGDAQDRGALVSQPRPGDLRRYTQDDVNAAINRFADPAMHCELLFARHPATQTEHAFVIVPSNVATPVMSKRDCQGVLAAQRCYVRKPGPCSEEPFTGEEWRVLIDRCVRAGRESMLDAIRHIVQGHAGAVPAEDALARLRAFARDGLARWQALTNASPANDPARMPHGYRELVFEILQHPTGSDPRRTPAQVGGG